ncbi:MAG: NUDIX hydrolase [Hyphomicrobiaceae bacterium]
MEPSFTRTSRLVLDTTREPWPFARIHAAQIARHWSRRVAENPAFYDGEVHVLRALDQIASGLHATLSLERFSAFLYWRDGMADDPGILDAFASAVVRSAEGHVVLGRAAAGTLSAGRLFLPGGFLDARDVSPSGTIDLAAAVSRELCEETGIDTTALQRSPGAIVVRHGRYCCFAVEYRSPLSSEKLVTAMTQAARSRGDGELSGLVVARTADDLAGQDALPHASFLVARVLAGE